MKRGSKCAEGHESGQHLPLHQEASWLKLFGQWGMQVSSTNAQAIMRVWLLSGTRVQNSAGLLDVVVRLLPRPPATPPSTHWLGGQNDKCREQVHFTLDEFPSRCSPFKAAVPLVVPTG